MQRAINGAWRHAIQRGASKNLRRPFRTLCVRSSCCCNCSNESEGSAYGRPVGIAIRLGQVVIYIDLDIPIILQMSLMVLVLVVQAQGQCQLDGIEPFRPATHPTTHPGGGQARLSAFADQAALEFGEGDKQVEHQASRPLDVVSMFSCRLRSPTWLFRIVRSSS